MKSGADSPMAGRKEQKLLAANVSGLDWLSDSTFEIRFERPEGFEFRAGQKIGVAYNDVYRDYSLINSAQDSELKICVRRIEKGVLSPVLGRAAPGDLFHITPAHGFFSYQPSVNPSVFVATGTGIAPFVAFVRAGAKDYVMLHGVRFAEELYYRDTLASSAKIYCPCLSGHAIEPHVVEGGVQGRVTDYLENNLTSSVYDFYLCGRAEMLRDAIHIIDRRFEGSRVFSELFF